MASKKKLLSQTISEDFTASPERNLEKENHKPISKLKSILATPNPQASPFCNTPLTSKTKGATLGNLLKMTVGLPESKPTSLPTQTPITREESQVLRSSAKVQINTPSQPPPAASQKLLEQPPFFTEGSSAPKVTPAATTLEDDQQPIIHRKPKKKHIVDDDGDIENSRPTEPFPQPQQVSSELEPIEEKTPAVMQLAQAPEVKTEIPQSPIEDAKVAESVCPPPLTEKEKPLVIEKPNEEKPFETKIAKAFEAVESKFSAKVPRSLIEIPVMPSIDPIAAEAERVRAAAEAEEQKRKKELISQLSKQQRSEYNELVSEARAFEKSDEPVEALGRYKRAHTIFPHDDRLVKKMSALEAIIAEEAANTVLLPDGWTWHKQRSEHSLDSKFKLPSDVYEKLFPYQREGVKWLWSLHKLEEGGILGDDMGLGKTIQISSFLSGLFASDLAKRVLILMPVSVIENWKAELAKWAPGVRVKLYHGTSTTQRDAELSIVARKGGICLSTYGMVLSAHEKLCEGDLEWDYIILDEGHKIKNPAIKLSQTLPLIKSHHRVILTGSPIQNNLQEMWALFDYACEGRLLADSRTTFKQQWEGPIILAQDKSATPYQVEKGLQLAESLRKLIEPYFLRREKKTVFAQKDAPPAPVSSSAESEATEKEDEPAPSSQLTRTQSQTLMCRKNDFIVWLPMSEVQRNLYVNFLSTSDIQKILNKTASPLAAITVLKKICDHPMLLHDDMSSLKEIELSSAVPIARDVKSIIAQSGKLAFVEKLLQNLFENGHRVLIFSQSRMMLNLIEKILGNFKFLRIDGTVTKTSERQSRINLFNSDHSYFCFLLTTGVGGLGINLTSADRVIIFDPAWTPIDDQAVDRVYRIGQTKDVVVYRLITCGTIEEKIYRKQVFKASLMKTVIELNEHSHRYFTAQELSELFTLDDSNYSATQKQLEAMHGRKRITDESLDQHLQFLSSLGMFGVSDHNLLFTESDWQPNEDGSAPPSDSDAVRSEVEDAHLDLMRSISTSNNKGKDNEEEGATPARGGKKKYRRKAKGQFTFTVADAEKISDTDKGMYDEALDNARAAERKDNEILALEFYFEALKICDSDVKLHQKILRLAHRCQILSLAGEEADE